MPRDPRLNLANLFYDEACQKHFISFMAEQYAALYENGKTCSPCVIYGPPRAEDIKRDMDQVPPTTNTDLSGLLRNTTPETSYISLEYNYNFIKDFLLWAVTTNRSDKVRIWLILSFFLVCPEVRIPGGIVYENTEPALSVAYFDGFERRFEVALCGILIHQKDRKENRSKIRAESRPPIDIVISELIFFNFIRASRPIDDPTIP